MPQSEAQATQGMSSYNSEEDREENMKVKLRTSLPRLPLGFQSLLQVRPAISLLQPQQARSASLLKQVNYTPRDSCLHNTPSTMTAQSRDLRS